MTYHGCEISKFPVDQHGKQKIYKVIGLTNIWVVKCAKCKEFVSTNLMWTDLDGTYKHKECLSKKKQALLKNKLDKK